MNTIFINLSNSPKRIASISGQKFNYAVFCGYKGFDAFGRPILNNYPSNLGYNSGQLAYKLASGNNLSVQLPPNKTEDLYFMWVYGNSGDGLFINWL